MTFNRLDNPNEPFSCNEHWVFTTYCGKCADVSKLMKGLRKRLEKQLEPTVLITKL